MTQAEVLAKLEPLVAGFVGQNVTPELRLKIETTLIDALREMSKPFPVPRIVDRTTDEERRAGEMKYAIVFPKSED